MSSKNDIKRISNYDIYNMNKIAINDVKLKESVIYNCRNNQKNNADDLYISDIYNDKKVMIKWAKQEGGAAGNTFNNNVTLSNPNYQYSVLNRQPLIDNKHLFHTNNTEPVVNLTYPFLWAKETENGVNSCGINYIPPRNSRMLTAITDTGIAYGLNYITNADMSKVEPVLQPGEVSISGYGHNYIHFGHSDKITIFCKSNKNECDRDDCTYFDNNNDCKKNDSDTQMFIIINANDKIIEIVARDITNKQTTNLNIRTNNVNIKVKDELSHCNTDYSQNSNSIIKTVNNSSNSTTEIMEGDKITINTKNYIVNAENVQIGNKVNIDRDNLSLLSKSVHLNSNNFNINSSNSVYLYGSNGVNIDTDGNVTIKGWHK